MAEQGEGRGAAESTRGRSYARSSVRTRVDAARSRAREARERVSEVRDDFADQAAERAERMRAHAGSRVGGVARAMRRAGDELRSEGDARLASVTDDLAGRLERLESWLDGGRPEGLLDELERLVRRAPLLLVGGTLAAGALLARLLRTEDPDVDIVFEPEGDWADEIDIEDLEDETTLVAQDIDAIDEGPYDIGGDSLRAMTPDVENISDEHPSTPPPDVAGETGETPVRTPIAGHETIGPGIRTGSSGAAALDAGSAGPSWGARRKAAKEREG
jgi:hypothetical protein